MMTSAVLNGVRPVIRRASLPFLLGLAGFVLLLSPSSKAQTAPPSPVFDCLAAPDLSKNALPEIVSDGQRVNGTIVLANGREGFPISSTRCVSQLLRFYQKAEAPVPPSPNPAPLPSPGPTIRARLGDVVELLFLDQINTLDYGKSIDVWETGNFDPKVPGAGCDQSSSGYPVLARDSSGNPTVVDKYPNCFHGSTSGNIHFHGTHTSPNGTADNVFLMVRPSPWQNGKPVITEAVARQKLGGFFGDCEQRLKANNLAQWPKLWTDFPKDFTDAQQQWLIDDGKGKPPDQQLWPSDQKEIGALTFPQYYIGAFPYCFVLPKYPGSVPPGSTLHMGQAPGTHWYHAHKHGSTALNVSNGMSGAFIIEGDGYDGFFDRTYAAFRQNTNTTWTRQQPTLVVNQYGTTPGLERGGGTGSPAFSVNGSLQPNLTMYPGQVQLWRIVNSSSIDGFYISALPAGFTWRQTAQDGVQFDNFNYQSRAQRPVFVAAGNRIDLLVKAPAQAGTGTFPFTVSQSPSVSKAQNGNGASVILFNILLAGSGKAMALVTTMPARPGFLKDILPGEVTPADAQTLTFNTTGNPGLRQHTINGVQFSEDGATVDIPTLNSVGEWKILNATTKLIDHPFHIHINPFQVTEVFDPNAPLLKNGIPVKDSSGKVVPHYVVSATQPTLQAGQCWLNPNDNTTWKPCAQAAPNAAETNIWWDTFPIAAAVTSGTVVIPGYFKMRTRFVDYAGSYVLHCHILAHEDRGMMMQVNVGPDKPKMQHH